MPVPECFFRISAQLTELLGAYKYAEARALILNGPAMDPALADYFLSRIEYHETYLGPFAPRKKAGAK
jgi:hypothetical protein